MFGKTKITNANFDTEAAKVPAWAYGPLTRVTDIDTDLDVTPNSAHGVAVTSAESESFEISYDMLVYANTSGDYEHVLDAHRGINKNAWVDEFIEATSIIQNQITTEGGYPYADGFVQNSIIGMYRQIKRLMSMLPADSATELDNMAIELAFTTDVTSDPALTVVNTSTNAPDDALYKWDFGDGSDPVYGAALTPGYTHYYATDDTFTVTLTVLSRRGGMQRLSKQVTIASAETRTNTTTIDETGDPDGVVTVTFDGAEPVEAGYVITNDTGKGVVASDTILLADSTDMQEHVPGTPTGIEFPAHTFLANGTYTVTGYIKFRDGTIVYDGVEATIAGV